MVDTSSTNPRGSTPSLERPTNMPQLHQPTLDKAQLEPGFLGHAALTIADATFEHVTRTPDDHKIIHEQATATLGPTPLAEALTNFTLGVTSHCAKHRNHKCYQRSTRTTRWPFLDATRTNETFLTHDKARTLFALAAETAILDTYLAQTLNGQNPTSFSSYRTKGAGHHIIKSLLEHTLFYGTSNQLEPWLKQTCPEQHATITQHHHNQDTLNGQPLKYLTRTLPDGKGSSITEHAKIPEPQTFMEKFKQHSGYRHGITDGHAPTYFDGIFHAVCTTPDDKDSWDYNL